MYRARESTVAKFSFSGPRGAFRKFTADTPLNSTVASWFTSP